MRVLLVSTYELGHQPLHVASPAAALEADGHDVRTLDISVQEWDPSLVEWAEGVAFSVPMHTATRLALKGAEEVKAARPDLSVSFYGLYAPTGEDQSVVDHAIAGEYEPGLIDWARSLGNGHTSSGRSKSLDRQRFTLPVRSGLPSLERYAHLSADGTERRVGYVEASHGCAHRCRHCPVPVVYDGRTRRVPVDVVLDDIEQLVAMGAEHITIGDPDFLNRWAHSMQVVEELHARFPNLTYDVTTKVEHLLKHRDLLSDLARTGCIFVVSAFETMNDVVLGYLDKGHTAADAVEGIGLLRAHGIEPRPSWLPFMPWTTVEDVVDIVEFVAEHDLVGNVDPVQLTIRLLIPPGSLMLDIPETLEYLGDYDPETLSYTWRAADPRADLLQERLTRLVEDGQTKGTSDVEIFCDVRDTVREAAGLVPADRDEVRGSTSLKPRLTEPWFCCAEPTDVQFSSLRR
jgi:radical SAM superfamily enzyme YgiQ (UPF0313 family)